MAATSSPRQRYQRVRHGRRTHQMTAAATMATVATLAVVVAACGRTGGDPPPPAPAPTTTTGSPVPVDAADFPDTVREYAEAAVAAWAAPDLIRLSELVTPEVQEEIIDIPGPPNLVWTFIRCDEPEEIRERGESPETSGDSEDDEPPECAFHNLDGDYLELTVDPEQLAGPRAVEDVTFERTPYPEDSEEYVAEFVSAWQDGNPPRMENLAVPEAANTFHQLQPTTTVEYVPDGTDDGMDVVTVVLAGADGEDTEIEIRVNPGLFGEPQAIRGAVLVES